MGSSKRAKKRPAKKKPRKKLSHLTTVVTVGQAARHCQISLPSLRNWIKAGQLAAFRTPGGHYRIELSELQRFLRTHGMSPYPGPTAPPRILIVDDEQPIVDFLVDFLRGDPRKFKLETATDGYEALIKVGAFKPSLLILDVLMPRLDGIEVCRRLKGDRKTREIKILGLTGYPDRIPFLLQAGADACLTKPVALRELEQALDRLLSLPGGVTRNDAT
jgi:excisionase family DNA binding protein